MDHSRHRHPPFISHSLAYRFHSLLPPFDPSRSQNDATSPLKYVAAASGSAYSGANVTGLLHSIVPAGASHTVTSLAYSTNFITVFANTLYVGAKSTSPALQVVGTAGTLSSASAQTTTATITATLANPMQFAFIDSNNVLYADNGLGLYWFQQSAGAWSQVTGSPFTHASGVSTLYVGLAYNADTSTDLVYVSSIESPGCIYSFSMSTKTFTKLVTGAAGTIFRGMQFVPKAWPVPTPTATATATGTATATYVPPAPNATLTSTGTTTATPSGTPSQSSTPSVSRSSTPSRTPSSSLSGTPSSSPSAPPPPAATLTFSFQVSGTGVSVSPAIIQQPAVANAIRNAFASGLSISEDKVCIVSITDVYSGSTLTFSCSDAINSGSRRLMAQADQSFFGGARRLSAGVSIGIAVDVSVNGQPPASSSMSSLADQVTAVSASASLMSPVTSALSSLTGRAPSYFSTTVDSSSVSVALAPAFQSSISGSGSGSSGLSSGAKGGIAVAIIVIAIIVGVAVQYHFKNLAAIKKQKEQLQSGEIIDKNAIATVVIINGNQTSILNDIGPRSTSASKLAGDSFGQDPTPHRDFAATNPMMKKAIQSA